MEGIQQIKRKFPEWRRQFNESLIEVLADDEKLSKEIIKMRTKREEASRELGRNARRIRGKGTKEPILRAVLKTNNGVEKELNTQ